MMKPTVHQTLLFLLQLLRCLSRPAYQLDIAYQRGLSTYLQQQLWKVPYFWAPPSLSQSAHHSLFPSIITHRVEYITTSAHIACIPTCSTTTTHSVQYLTYRPCTQKIQPRDGASYIGHFNEATMSTVAKAISILVAAHFLVGSILYGLYFAQTPLQRLGFIQVFTIVFALCAGLVTNAKRAELFAMTAG